MVADLVVVAFFYLLRVGKYLAPKNCQPKCTIPLQKCDVRLWHKGHLLDHESDLAALLCADCATISIANTKNGTKSAFVRHDAFGGDICPVTAVAQWVANLCGMPAASTPLSTVCHPPTWTTRVSNWNVTIDV